MQSSAAIEESKGADLNIGGYESDSEDEREKKEEEEEKLTTEVEFNTEGKAALAANKPSTLLVASCEHS